MPVLDNARHERAYYVYFLIDPRDGQIFYIGKGKGERVSAHVKAVKNGRLDNGVKGPRISEILSEGLEVVEHIHAPGLTEAAAYALERSLIREHRTSLTNIACGIVTSDESILAKAIEMRRRIKTFRQWVFSTDAERLRQVVDAWGCPLQFYNRFLAEFDEDIGRLARSLDLITAQSNASGR